MEQQIREVFDREIAQRSDAEEVAKLELLREYFCNAEFRRAMHDEVARINGVDDWREFDAVRLFHIEPDPRA